MKRFLLILVALVVSLPALPAQQLRLLSYDPGDPYHTYTLAGPSGLGITLISRGAITRDQQDQLERLYSADLAFDAMEVREIRAIVEETTVEINLKPSLFRQDGYDLIPFVPAGIQLYYKDELRYDFRVLIGHYFLRLRGDFTGDSDLASVILAVAERPADYLNVQTSQQLDERFGEIQSDVADLKEVDVQQAKTIGLLQEDLGELQQSRAEVARGVADVQGEISAVADTVAIVQSTVGDLRAELETSKTDISKLLEFQKSLADDLAGDQTESALDQIGTRYTSLSTDFETLRKAVLTLNNRRGRAMDQTAVDRAVEIKNTDRSLTAAQVSRQLKEEGFSLSTRELELVFKIYLGEL